MAELTRDEMIELIERNIREFGYHVYFVSGDAVPRFAYTIGLTSTQGAELVLAGAILYSADETKRILAAAKEACAAKNHSHFQVEGLGGFTFQEVHPSWTTLLLLGAIDFYARADVLALQIVPDQAHMTIDVPNLSNAWSPEAEPVWQWLRATWEYDVPRESTVTTNLAALRGQLITEVCRWGDDEWEMFAGPGPDVTEAEARVVPLGSLLAADPSLKDALSLEVGRGIWRNDTTREWNPWGS